MRVIEGLRLRVKDLDLERRKITVREGREGKDRITMVPENLELPLREQLARAKRLHEPDLAAGYGAVSLPTALWSKYPNASKSWGWQYVFPSTTRSVDPRMGKVVRHHFCPGSMQRAASSARGSAPGAPCKTGASACAAPFVRDPPASGRLRHPHRAGAAWSRRGEHHDDLYARAEQGRPSRSQLAERDLSRHPA